MTFAAAPSPAAGTPATPPRPDEVTLSTCIGCGAMGLPGRCPDGCAPERKLELVAAAELERLIALTERVEIHAAALAAAAESLAQTGLVDRALVAASARAALAAHGSVAPRLRELAAQPIQPVVSWWCPRCGGVDAPQPCLGVCIRTPVRWANAARAREMQARAAGAIERDDELRAVLTLVAHTHPQPGHAEHHWDAVRRRATRALAG